MSPRVGTTDCSVYDSAQCTSRNLRLGADVDEMDRATSR